MAKRQRRRRRERRRKHAEEVGPKLRPSLISGAGIVAGAVIGIASPAFAADYTVNVSGDSGDGNCDATCTLRDAVAAANADGETSHIYFASSITGTVELTQGQLLITDPYGTTAIVGPTDRSLTISVAPGDYNRIFYVGSGRPFQLSHLRLTNGSSELDGLGGAIDVRNGTLRLEHAVLSGNRAVFGGAVAVPGGYLGSYDEIGDTTFYDNHADEGGGAVSVSLYGGAHIYDSTFVGNSATRGGAVYSASPSGTPTLIAYSTISGNSASSYGGGVYGKSDVRLFDTVLADSLPDGAADAKIKAGFLDAAFSLIENPGTATIGGPLTASDITGVDPQLGALVDNGGDTPTMLPAPGSPVVDSGYAVTPDQRGITRPVDNSNVPNASGGNAADIGAVELTLAEGPQPPPTPSPTPGVTPTPTPSGSTFNLKKAIRHCKKKFRRNAKKRRECIRKAKKKAQSLS